MLQSPWVGTLWDMCCWVQPFPCPSLTPGAGYVGEQYRALQTSSSPSWCHVVQKHGSVEPCLSSCPQNWEMTGGGCVKLLSFGVVCCAVIDNRDPLMEAVTLPFRPSFPLASVMSPSQVFSYLLGSLSDCSVGPSLIWSAHVLRVPCSVPVFCEAL